MTIEPHHYNIANNLRMILLRERGLFASPLSDEYIYSVWNAGACAPSGDDQDSWACDDLQAHFA